MNKQAEEQNVFAVVNDVFEIVSKPFYGDRQIAEVRLKEAAKVINSYCTAHAQAEQERAVRAARIDELRDYPLNWADNRKDTVWRSMLISRIDQLQKGDSDARS